MIIVGNDKFIINCNYFYNDLLFEIYHYIPRSHIPLLNKSSKRMQVINGQRA